MQEVLFIVLVQIFPQTWSMITEKSRPLNMAPSLVEHTSLGRVKMKLYRAITIRAIFTI